MSFDIDRYQRNQVLKLTQDLSKLEGQVDTSNLRVLKRLIETRLEEIKESIKERSLSYESSLLDMTVDFDGSVSEAIKYMNKKENGYRPMRILSYRENVWYHSLPPNQMVRMDNQHWPITRNIRRNMQKLKDQQKLEDDAQTSYKFARRSPKKVRRSPKKVRRSPKRQSRK